MKATGMIRRFDDVGKIVIVIPREIRQQLEIKEGQAMEIFTDREGRIILHKYDTAEEKEG